MAPVTPGIPASGRRPVWRHPEFAQGVRDILPAALGVAAWGLITGVAMGKSGQPIGLMVAMSLLVFAGSAQLAVLPLMSSGAPIGVVWATALCVNLRFVIFSAQWRPYFIGQPRSRRLWLGYFTGDLNYVIFMKRFPEPRAEPGQLPYYWGCVVCSWVGWQGASMLGLFTADAVPVHWGVGFAGTLALLGLAMSLLTDRGTAVAGAVAGCAAVAAFALPYKLNVVVAIAAAVAVGVVIDHATPRRAAKPADESR